MAKKFSELKRNMLKSMFESWMHVARDGGPAAVDGGRSWDWTHDKGFLGKLNQYLENFGTKKFFDPVGATVRLRGEMNIIGIDFPYTNESGEGVFPVRKHTEMIGSQNPDGTFVEMSDDGITKVTGHPLSMSIQFESTGDGFYYVHAGLINPNDELEADDIA